MKFLKGDRENCDNLLRALKKGTFTLEGMEVIAMADVFKLVNNLSRCIDEDLAAQAALTSAKPAELESPISET